MTLLVVVRSGHDVSAAASGVEEPRSGPGGQIATVLVVNQTEGQAFLNAIYGNRRTDTSRMPLSAASGGL